MAFDYATVVPWGRSYDEYLHMFDLGPADVERSILGCGDGPASFNSGMRRRGRRVVSVDPLYRLRPAAVARLIRDTYDDVIAQTRRERARFVWREIPSVEALGRRRLAAMREFLADYESGRAQGRYLAAALPRLPFAARSFDLALCSHLLLFYADQLSLPFHVEAVRELCRVAAEVRVFPLLDVNGARSAHLAPLLAELVRTGVEARIRKVPYEFQRGGNELLQLRPLH